MAKKNKLIDLYIERDEMGYNYWIIKKDDPIWEINTPEISLQMDEDFVARFEKAQIEYFNMMRTIEQLFLIQENQLKRVDDTVTLPAFKRI